MSVLITLPALAGLEIAPKKYHASMAIGESYLDTNFTTQRLKYPEVKKVGAMYEIRQPLGALPHAIPKKLFVTDMRVFADGQMAGKELTAKVTIHGKNLPRPLEKELKIQFGN